MKTRLDGREGPETAVVVGWLRARRLRFFGVPNGAYLGGRNRYAVVGKLKAEGLLPGAPDLVLIDRAPRTGQPVALEMKRLSGGRLSSAQKSVIASMEDAGWAVVVGHGALDAISKLHELGY